MHPIKNILPTLLTFLCCSLFSFPSFLPSFLPSAHAKAGDLDVNFGEGGLVKLTGWQLPQGLAIRDDGKIVIGLRLENAFVLRRYNPDGSLDDSFGDGGEVKIIDGLFVPTDGLGFLHNLAIQQDGKVLVVGTDYQPHRYNNLVIQRYHPDGTLDTSFGNLGQVLTNYVSAFNWYTPILIQPDGKFLVGVSTIGFTPSGFDFLTLRFNSNGTLDQAFGAGGVVVTNFALESIDDLYAMALQPDGKILVAGTSQDPGEFIVLVRYNPNGSLDSSFGEGGLVRTSIGADYRVVATVWGLMLQPDGKIMVTGSAFSHYNSTTQTSNKDLILLRYLENGSPDPAFGEGGKLLHPLTLSNGNFVGFLFQPDGKSLFLVGPDQASDYDLALLRYNLDGIPDNEFGNGGMVMQDFEGEQNSDGGGMAAYQPDGKILVAWAWGTRIIPTSTPGVFRQRESGAFLTRFLGDTTTGPSLSGNVVGKGGCTCDLRQNPDRSDYFSWLLMVLGGVGVLFWRWRCVKGELH